MSIDKFFTAIKNGSWHSINELSDQLGITTSKLTELLKLLSKHGLIKHQKTTE